MKRTILVKGQPLEQPIDLSSFFSGIREAQGFKAFTLCGNCEGRGVIPKDGKMVTCTECNGSGRK